MTQAKGSELTLFDPLLPGLLPVLEITAMIDSFRVETVGNALTISRMPNGAERAVLQKRNASLTGYLQPALHTAQSKVALRTDLAVWFGGYPSLRNADHASMVASYVTYLQTMPLWAVRKVIAAIIAGSVTETDGRGGHKPISADLPPSATRMKQLAEKEINPYRDEQWKVDRILNAKKLTVPEIDPEERKNGAPRVRSMMEDYHRQVAAGKADQEERRAELSAVAAAAHRASNDRMILDEYARIGMQPVYADDMLVSPMLVKKNRQDDVALRAAVARPSQEGGS
jgi:hypothetical protein